MTSWSAFWATVPLDPGERRTKVEVINATAVTHTTGYAVNPANLVGGSDALRDGSDSSYVHIGEQIFLTTNDEARGELAPALIPASAKNVRLEYGMRWRAAKTLGGFGSMGLFPFAIIDPNPTTGAPPTSLLTSTKPSGYGGSYIEAQYNTAVDRLEGRHVLQGTLTSTLPDAIVSGLRGGGYGWRMLVNGAPDSDPAFYFDLFEVFLAARYTAGRTPLRARQRDAGTTGLVPLRGRNNGPYGVRARQNANL